MKVKRILYTLIFVFIATFLIGCDEELSKGETYNISLTQVEHASFKVVNREESVSTAHKGQKLFVSIVFEQGYELDKVYVNDKGIDGASFTMPGNDVNVTISVKEIISTISIVQSTGGTVKCDKTQAKYGEKIHITVTPDVNYYVNSKGLKVNSAEVTISPIYTETTFEYVMPHTDITISANFLPPTIYGGENFGDFDYDLLGRNSAKWNYTQEANNEISISLKGSGDGAKQRDIGYTYYLEKSNYFYFKTEVQITNFNIGSTYENRVGIFFGDGSKMGTVGYYFKKYTSTTDLLIGRKYTSLTFDSGYRTAITGFQNIMIGEPGLPTSDTLSNGTVPTSCGGKANINKNDFSNVVMKIGIIYDGINHKLHILLGLDDEELKYVRTIDTYELNYGSNSSSSDPQYFNVGEDGSVNFGLYAEAAHEMTFKFFNIEYLTDKDVIETRFFEIKGQ